MDCIYCKIINKELASHTVMENDRVSAFFDLLPISPGHTVVAPKKHVPDVESIAAEDWIALAGAVKTIGQALLDGLGVKGYTVFLDNKSAANQHVPHVHFHVVPRAEGDGLGRWPQGTYQGPEEASDYLAKIKKVLK